MDLKILALLFTAIGHHVLSAGIDGWMTCDFYVLFNTVSVISGQWDVDIKRLCAMELRLRLRIFRLERESNSVR